MEQLKQNKGYILAIVILSLIGGIEASFYPLVTGSKILHALGTAGLAVVMNCLIGFVVLLISWIFTRKITASRFFLFSTIICALWALSPVVDLVRDIIKDDPPAIEDDLTSDNY